MRRFVSFLFLLLALAPAIVHSQGFNPAQAPPWAFADNYGRWAFQAQGANNFVIQGPSICRVTQLNYGDSSVFEPAAHTVTLAPVLIYDSNSANAEVLTPGSSFSNSNACGWTLPATHPHISFSLQSGTGGLQEAINAVGPTTAAYPVLIYLTPAWYKLVAGISSLNSTLASQVTPTTILADAVCTSKVVVVDITKVPATTYGCSGGSLVVVGSGSTLSGVVFTGTPLNGEVPVAITSTTGVWGSPGSYFSINGGSSFAAPNFNSTLPAAGANGLNATWQSSGQSVSAEIILPVLDMPGLTGSITGTSLTASCDSGTATVTGAAVGDPVSASAVGGADLGAAFDLRASVTAANTVTVYICAPVSGTPATQAYNVVVHHALTY